MSFILHGYIDGVAYHLNVPDDGEVDGTDNAMDLLDEREGTQVKVTPTGPVVRVDRADPESILGAFTALTQITRVDGDIPELYEPEQIGVVY